MTPEQMEAWNQGGSRVWRDHVGGDLLGGYATLQGPRCVACNGTGAVTWRTGVDEFEQDECDACEGTGTPRSNRPGEVIRGEALWVHPALGPIDTADPVGWFGRNLAAMVDQFIDRIVQTEDMSPLFDVLPVIEAQRRRLDRVQAVPPARR